MANDNVSTGGIEQRIASLEKALHDDMQSINSNISSVAEKVDTTQAQLAQLRDDFQQMVEEQRKTSSLEQASTELVTVRQEMDKKFGNYRSVRNSMIGILQATDAALVRKATVSQVSEQLMISTPDYWLAPVLVALAAWINNDHDLADRAIREAVKRDNEHTSLVMALICRRNNRTQACYEWLARYFATQDASNMDEDVMVYIDAYVNDIFGSDEKHMCDDYITRWINQIRGSNSDFENEQTQTWNEYFNKFSVDTGNKYPALKECVTEFGYIDAYLGRVHAADGIAHNFESIRNAYFDPDALRKEVDKHLIQLVSADDEAERELRGKEEYLLAVKACQGDTKAAKEIVNKRREEEQSKTMDIVSQMTHVISDDKKVPTSEKKMAVNFLHGFINEGFHQYITEKKDSFPKQISIEVNGWKGESDGTNESQLQQSYSAFLTNLKADEQNKIEKKCNVKMWKILAIVFAVIGAISLVGAGGLGVLLLIAAAALGILFAKSKKRRAEEVNNLEQKTQTMSLEGSSKISDCVRQWNQACEDVRKFEITEDNEIVA